MGRLLTGSDGVLEGLQRDLRDHLAKAHVVLDDVEFVDSRPRISRACILRELFVYDEWWEVRLREIIRQRSELVVVGHGVGYC